MYEYMKDGMTEAIWLALERKTMRRFEVTVLKGKIKEALDQYWHDKIAIVWNIEDVQEYAKENYNVDIEDEPAREILNDVFDNMDYGVTYQTIDANISDYLEKKSPVNLFEPPEPTTIVDFFDELSAMKSPAMKDKED